MDAFLGAADLGADGVELDVRRTADGRLGGASRRRAGRRHVDREATFRDLPAPCWTLPGARRIAPLRWSTSRSRTGPTTRTSTRRNWVALGVVDLLNGRAANSTTAGSSSRASTCPRSTESTSSPGLATGWLFGLVDSPPRSGARADERGHVAVHPHHMFVDEDLVRLAHDAGLAVNTWTCDEPERIRWLADSASTPSSPTPPTSRWRRSVADLASADDELGDHPGLSVAGEIAHHCVGARFNAVELERVRLARAELRALLGRSRRRAGCGRWLLRSRPRGSGWPRPPRWGLDRRRTRRGRPGCPRLSRRRRRSRHRRPLRRRPARQPLRARRA